MVGSEDRNVRMLGSSRIGPGTLVADDVVIGHPAKATLADQGDFSVSQGSVVGERCILRSGTVIYEDVIIGNEVQTAHHVVIREGVRIGDGCVFGSGSVVREQAVLGRNVRLMDLVVISEGAQLGNDIFIGTNSSFTAGRYLLGAMEASGRLSHDEVAAVEGRNWDGPSVVVEDDVRIGANAVILAGVRLGKGCVVAAGAVVSTDVPPGSLAAGNPARLLKSGANPQKW
jgi:acetyltransferase-like isoleucine patch superfamily enzyme